MKHACFTGLIVLLTLLAIYLQNSVGRQIQLPNENVEWFTLVDPEGRKFITAFGYGWPFVSTVVCSSGYPGDSSSPTLTTTIHDSSDFCNALIGMVLVLAIGITTQVKKPLKLANNLTRFQFRTALIFISWYVIYLYIVLIEPLSFHHLFCIPIAASVLCCIVLVLEGFEFMKKRVKRGSGSLDIENDCSGVFS